MISAIATLPLNGVDQENRPRPLSLLQQLDPDVPNVVTLGQTFEDLLFDAIAWWEIIGQDSGGYPTSIRRRDPSSVSLQPPNDYRSLAPLPSGQDPRGASVWIDGREVPIDKVMRFDSPNPGILTAGAKTIRQWLLLDGASSLYASDPRPLDYFTPAEGAEEIPDEEVQGILAQWRDARKRRATGWVPAALKYNSVDSPTPQELQLAELKREVRLEIANLVGVDPEDLGVSTTSRTYANAVDRRRDRINDVLAPYMRAVTDRLSMGDVTRRGVRVVWDLRDYLKSNPTEQASVHKTYHDMGALELDEIRYDIGRPPLGNEAVREAERIAREAAAAQPLPPAGQMPEDMMTNSRPTGLQLDATDTTPNGMRRLELAATSLDFRVESESRTIWGLAIPYGQVVEKWGMRFRFQPGSIEWSDQVSRVKLLRDHSFSQAIGYATKLTQTREGVVGKYKLGRGPMADEALMGAEDGVLDGLSAGVEFDLENDVLLSRDGVYDVYRAHMSETSLTAMPAFDDARVTKVAASRTEGNRAMEDCASCGQQHAPGVACASRPQNQPAPPANQQQQAPAGLQLNDDQLRTLMAQPGVMAALAGVPAQQQATTTPQGFTLSAEQLGMLAAGGHLRNLLSGMLGAPAEGNAAPAEEPRQVVDPTRRTVAVTATREAPSYRFDSKGMLQPAKHDFGLDMIAALKGGNNPDTTEHRRVMEFIRAQFDVVSSDVNELNPTIQMPRYIDQREFRYPIWSAINKGAPPNGIQPFQWPKFNTAAGLTGAHVEGVEPASGTFTTTSQSVTPTPNSGKAKISRETWDMGGMPGISDLIWRQMMRGWFEALEAAIVTELNAATPTSLGAFTVAGGTLPVGSPGTTLANEMRKYLSALHFVRGGFSFETAFTQIDLYQHLAGAVDSTGRPIFPAIGPTNADGTIETRYQSINVNGLPFLPAWALAATGIVPASSYLIDPVSVDGWASAPNQLIIDQTEVANVYIGMWGYKATAINDISGVREIIYDPAV